MTRTHAVNTMVMDAQTSAGFHFLDAAHHAVVEVNATTSAHPVKAVHHCAIDCTSRAPAMAKLNTTIIEMSPSPTQIAQAMPT